MRDGNGDHDDDDDDDDGSGGGDYDDDRNLKRAPRFAQTQLSNAIGSFLLTCKRFRIEHESRLNIVNCPLASGVGAFSSVHSLSLPWRHR